MEHQKEKENKIKVRRGQEGRICCSSYNTVYPYQSTWRVLAPVEIQHPANVNSGKTAENASNTCISATYMGDTEFLVSICPSTACYLKSELVVGRSLFKKIF